MTPGSTVTSVGCSVKSPGGVGPRLTLRACTAQPRFNAVPAPMRAMPQASCNFISASFLLDAAERRYMHSREQVRCESRLPLANPPPRLASRRIASALFGSGRYNLTMIPGHRIGFGAVPARMGTPPAGTGTHVRCYKTHVRAYRRLPAPHDPVPVANGDVPCAST